MDYSIAQSLLALRSGMPLDKVLTGAGPTIKQPPPKGGKSSPPPRATISRGLDVGPILRKALDTRDAALKALGAKEGTSGSVVQTLQAALASAPMVQAVAAPTVTAPAAAAPAAAPASATALAGKAAVKAPPDKKAKK